MTGERFVVEPIDAARDVDAVLALETESFTNPTTRDMLTWELAHSDVARIWVVRTPEDRVAGFCSCWLVFDELHVHTLAIRSVWRRRGLGRALIRRVLSEAVAEGARRTTLEVRRSNEAALALYQGLGFRVAGIRAGYYTAPVEDALILWLDGLPEGP